VAAPPAKGEGGPFATHSAVMDNWYLHFRYWRYNHEPKWVDQNNHLAEMRLPDWFGYLLDN